MKIEDQVCCIELAKKLKELGIKQDSAFYYCPAGFNADTGEWHYHLQIIIKEAQEYKSNNVYSAFTVPELLSILNARITICRNHGSDAIMILYEPEHGTDNSYNFVGNNLADLLANVLIAQHAEGELTLP